MLTHRALSLHPLHEVTKKHGNSGKNIFSDNRSRLSGILTGLSAAFGDLSLFPTKCFLKVILSLVLLIKHFPTQKTGTICHQNEMRIIFCPHHHSLNANPSKTIGKLGSCFKSKHLRLNFPTCIKNIKVPTGKLGPS